MRFLRLSAATITLAAVATFGASGAHADSPSASNVRADVPVSTGSWSWFAGSWSW